MTDRQIFTVSPEIGFDDALLKAFLQKHSGGRQYHINKRSIDARSKEIKVHLSVTYYAGKNAPVILFDPVVLKNVFRGPEVIIVGSGPAGLFAALRLIERGIKPVIIERGKDVRARRRDLAAINKHHEVNPDSNYCFGEGGAGTYSDGKLYTRSDKRGSIRRILEIFVAHGAKEDILWDAHPHIGTNKLPQLVASVRETILECGGEVHFNTRMTELVRINGKAVGIKTDSGSFISGKAVLLATGHSARDVYEYLDRERIQVEAKPFALGVRIEHPRQIIDRIQYHRQDRGILPPSYYSLVEQVPFGGEKRGVFSFCMCPGGFIVPAATCRGEVVVNGMSPSRRDSKYSNSGIVVAVEASDIAQYKGHGAMAMLKFQADIEQLACQLAGNNQTAPAQRMVDFTQRKVSDLLNDTSYQPGLLSLEMREVLPPFIAERLSMAFHAFGRKMRGYFTNEAQIVGVESRTSSPVRIPRDAESLQHPQLAGLFPCGEGAGYAGGIVSAALDGDKCAEAISAYLNIKN